jgi:hypothetical protein
MSHPTQEQMVDHYYSETAECAAHLVECAECRAAFGSLKKALDAVDLGPIPEPAPDFEARVWNRLRPSLYRRRTDQWPKTLVLMGAIAAMLVIAFLAGRASKPAKTIEQARVPVLVVAVGDHLERLEAVLQELENSSASQTGQADISFEQSSAEELLEFNRLYRQTASASGDLATASVLEDVELALLDIAHQPGTVSAAQLEDLRRGLAEREILFKLRVLGDRLKGEELQTTKENRL